MPLPLYLALAQGTNFGWGVCSHYLRQELGGMYRDVRMVDEHTPPYVTGSVFHALADLEFNALHQVRGTKNFGYTFFENELTARSVENSAQYECVLAGSTWCLDKLREKGVEHSDLLIQGIDTSRFFPLPPKEENNLFIIFSGGKFELRKGQDLVLSAFKILQKKYQDMVLINCWYNSWPQTIALFQHSRHIQFEAKGESWKEFMLHIYRKNDLDPDRIITLDLVDNQSLRELYAKTDLAVFPNRCEGGTNLVLMEYMACAKPVIASCTSGHKDVVTRENALLLDELHPYQLYDAAGNLWADWEEPSVDQLVALIEYAYHHRQELRRLGERAGQDLQRLTWTQSARSLLNTLLRYDGIGREDILPGH
ncbi:glycosyl transferase group 1 [Desulfobulbus propionicus DSM 2032]|uniref:Glycosyl transferase group 1 n=1 Tax=Desulfobulbus propionicus (strain ATCC 33891 / DSM 2032 / VKM B-1956 / 1pr3) TaxID=577650 RepID=A0A7U3YMW4_DESPD|nr:glycosyltransferase family 4 protein [Desulfobulbus propionicus]ADW18305.1 glycosyl transferase group 1 [Desulfobulbus propionicus DSM 2032]